MIIDQIFGSLACSLRGKEILTTDCMLKILNNTGMEHPQWNAHKIEVLHSLFDIDTWAKSMKCSPIERIFDSKIVDQQGEYTGMMDFLFREHHVNKVRLNYRESCRMSWRPYESPEGIQTITSIPLDPPGLAKFKERNHWFMSGTYTFDQTIFMASGVAKTINMTLSQQEMIDHWKDRLNMIPACVELLPEEHKVVFEYFDDRGTYLFLGNNAGGSSEQQNDKDAEYDEWKRMWLNVRDEPFAIDPVISSEQTKAQYESKKRAMQEALRSGRGPTVDTKHSLIFDGDLLLAKENNSVGVSLYKVEALGKAQTPRSVDLQLTCLRFDHVPEPDLDGLWGTFRPSKDESGLHLCKVILMRSNLVVCNVQLITSKKALSLESLKALCRALPEVYAMPEKKNIPVDRLPEDENEEGDREQAQRSTRRSSRAGQRKRRAAPPNKVRSNKNREDESDSDEEEQTQRQRGAESTSRPPNGARTEKDDEQDAASRSESESDERASSSDD
ncbi:MAG: hypothetical protein ACO3XZ_07520, partial [Ilumatobacteraceae bacterium]